MTRRPLIPLIAAVLAAVAGACARQGAPSGGPQDRRPPVIVSVSPDTFAVVEPDGGSIRIRFDEPLSERPTTGTLAQAVQVSPRTGEVQVRHDGDGLAVDIEGGFQPGVVYRVTVLPVVQDRFQNALLDPFEWVFSTGPDFEPNALGGELWDRVTGAPVPAMDVFAVSADSVRYVARSDSLGLFVMRFLPAGPYELRSFDDRNQSGTADPFEMQGEGGEVRLGPTDTLLTSFWVMVPDTTPPQLARGEKIDSSTLRLVFDDPLDPGQSLEGLVRGMYRDSGDTPGVLRALHPWDYRVWADSVAEARAAEVAAATAAAAAAAPAAAPPAADTAVAPPPDTTGAVAPAARPGAAAPPAARAGGRAPREFLPNGERVPSTEVVLLLRGAIEGGELYTVLLGPVANISGLARDEWEGAFRLPEDPQRPVADSTRADSAAIAPDTAAVDTAGIVPPVRDTLRGRSP